MVRIRPILYLHLLRTWRYKYSFINSTLNIALWMAIFILGALVFVPPEQLPTTAPYIFWGVVLWTLLSSSVWYIGGWMWFFLSLGMIEEHMIHNMRVMPVLIGRIITVTVQLALVTPVMYVIVSYATGGSIPLIHNPVILAYALVSMIIMSISYGLILAAISIRTGVPGALLDISNFLLFIMGGIAVPVTNLPDILKKFAMFVPYSHPSELVRYAAAGITPYLPLWIELTVSGIVAAAMLIATYLIFRYIEDHYLRIQGPRAIGRM